MNARIIYSKNNVQQVFETAYNLCKQDCIHVFGRWMERSAERNKAILMLALLTLEKHERIMQQKIKV